MQQPTPRPHAELLWPRPSLAGCIFGTFVRDTRGCALTSPERMNYFPAGPYCCVSWFFEGQAHIIDGPAGVSDPAATPPLPHLLFNGPHTRPTVSWNPGPVYGMIMMFHPDAIAALAGVDISALVDRKVPAQDVLGGAFLSACEAMMLSGTAHDRYRRFEERLDPLWQKARPPGHVAAQLLEDWTRTLAVRAATSAPGSSLRQIERRIRAWTGQSMRGLQKSVRAEQAHALYVARRGEPMDLAQFAADAGFADQSHMTRHIKRETGFTPTQLRDLMETEEAFWSFRLMGERF